MKRVLLFGSDGQLGQQLLGMMDKQSIELFTCSRQGGSQANHIELDLSDFGAVKMALKEVEADVVINAAAYTAVDQAESERELAMAVNAEAVRLMASELKTRDAKIIHFSSDYVYDGSGQHAKTEEETTQPLNFYGMSKLKGDEAIMLSGVQHTIFRTSWVFSSHGSNFVKSMLKHGREKNSLKIVDDQVGSPTSTRLLAELSLQALSSYLNSDGEKVSGLFHVCCSGFTSWFGFADQIFEQAKGLGFELAVEELLPIKTSEYPTPARRPFNSRLDCRKLEECFGIKLPLWQEELAKVLIEIKGYQY